MTGYSYKYTNTSYFYLRMNDEDASLNVAMNMTGSSWYSFWSAALVGYLPSNKSYRAWSLGVGSSPTTETGNNEKRHI